MKNVYNLKLKFYLIVLCSAIHFSSLGQINTKIGEHDLESIAYLKKNPKKMKLVKLLLASDLKNGQRVYDNLKLNKENTGNNDYIGLFRFGNGVGFKTKNPYLPKYIENYDSLGKLNFPLPKNKLSYEHDEENKTITYFNQRQITEWYSKRKSDQSVCAVKFTDDTEKSYSLKTFKNNYEAESEGYIVTHKTKCGTCSSLKDLAVYIAKPDLTSPVRFCAMKLTLGLVKNCIANKVGFTEYCAETWAYNAYHTRLRCIGICIKDYGLKNIILRNIKGSIMDKNGELRPCIACDEYRSGPGFKYAAGRTRRESGLKSRIVRKKEEIHKVNHFKYFKQTKSLEWEF
ncbi:hypothetical protein OAK75_01630 [Bacteriovoracales bacterium]|nr:hypothetical protein [Bacteriovoracales bacterium]